MLGPTNPFPLAIPEKIDSWDKLQLLQHLNPSLKLTAEEINKLVQALEYLYNNVTTGGYQGNLPIRLKPVLVDHSAVGTTASKVATVMNAGGNYPLADGYGQWFYTQRMVLTNGEGINDGAPGSPNYAVITEFFVLAKKIPLVGGVASLGSGGTTISAADLIALPAKDSRNFAPQEFNLGDIGVNAIWTAANDSGPRSTPNASTIVFKALQGGVAKAWLYLGEQENVGTGFPAVGSEDFRLFSADGSDVDPAPAPAQRIYSDYLTISAMLSRQGEQNNNRLILVADASADTSLHFVTGETKKYAVYRYNGSSTNNLADYTMLFAPYSKRKTAIIADTGTVIDLSDPGGGECNMLSANSNSAFTVANAVPGGERTVLINRSTEPTISGATKIFGHTFLPSTNMHLKVKCRQTGIVQYYFLKL